MKPLDKEARKFLNLAAQDELILDKLLNDADISDATWGFHAQQAIEKLLKSVLTKKTIVFPKTHDLTVLSELLLDAQVELSFETDPLDELEQLTPFATAFRYEDSVTVSIDRKSIQALIKKIRRWAEMIVQDNTR